LQPSSASVAFPDFNYSKALSDRLQILLYTYRLTGDAMMTSQKVDHLWALCTTPIDREAIMDFLADGSNDAASENNKGQQTISANQQIEYHPVFPAEVCSHIFENLFCSADVGWECLGEVAFGSFQMLFKSLGSGILKDSVIKDRAIDALWRICLSAGNENVATNAMNELLDLYIQSINGRQTNETNEAEPMPNRSGESFSKRIFECLVQVKEDLQRGNSSSLRSAERCIKILKRAFDMSTLGGGVGAVAERLRRTNENDLNAYLKKIPHGLRGVSSCITVLVMAKKLGNCERFAMEVHLLQSFASIKMHVASRCGHDPQMMKLNNITGRPGNNPRNYAVNSDCTFPDTAIAADMGISEGNELIFTLIDKVVDSRPAVQNENTNVSNAALDLSSLLNDEGVDNSFGVFFDTLISVLESLPASQIADSPDESNANMHAIDSHSLVWDVLMAMPTNARVSDFVQKAAMEWKASESNTSGDAMVIDSAWSSLIDISHFERSVYVLQVLDLSLRPPPLLFSCLPSEMANALTSKMLSVAQEFQSDFIRSGGFEAVLRLFVESGTAEKKTRRRMRMGNEFALRILSTCFFGGEASIVSEDEVKITKEGLHIMRTFPNIGDFLRSLMYIVVDDEGVADTAILKVLRLIEAMLKSDEIFTTGFAKLPEGVTERFLTSLLLWEGSVTNIKNAATIRKKTEDMILETPLLCSSALPFLVGAMKNLDSFSEGSSEFFSAMMKMVAAAKSQPRSDLMDREMEELGIAVCDKLALYPRPTDDNEHIDYSTGVLCGCLNLLMSLIDLMGGGYLQRGSQHLLEKLNHNPWCEVPGRNPETIALINLMGTIFDCFVSSSQSPGSPSICSDKKSRQLAFRVILAAAAACNSGEGYQVLVSKIQAIMSHVTPSMRHTWAHSLIKEERNALRNSNTSKYSGLKNQGCTCYMNSFLQQLFMMPMLRKSLCSAEIPSSLRSSGGGVTTEGRALIGKKISLHWDCGNNYDAIVDDFDEKTGMHTIRYLPIQLASQYAQQVPPNMPEELPEQFILSEGRAGRETGAFEILNNSASNDVSQATTGTAVSETEDEASSRKLLEEVQRTFVNLDEARGRCFDPRSLVEASNCLKLEFDVWQQNDASEFAMKLLDRLEISLKKWSPSVFKYLAHTFGLKTTKQKICKECGLKVSSTPFYVKTIYHIFIISHSLISSIRRVVRRT
jgi:ubiquitin carboxyl-terminal hydrolase 9/24